MKIVEYSRSHISLPSPAKLNLFLHIYQQREDGFHDLDTLFQLIDLHDRIDIELIELSDKAENNLIIIKNPSLDILEKDDICYKAAKLLQKEIIKKNKLNQDVDLNLSAKITVEKNIPHGGGLGGGSSNAATVLIGLNKLWEAGFSQSELQLLGLQLGSDVPVFIYGKTVLASGRGEIFTEISECFVNRKIDKKFIVLRPECMVSTAELFQSNLLAKRHRNSEMANIKMLDFSKHTNDFEAVVFEKYPKILKAKQALDKYSPSYLTGTGSCIYSVLDDSEKADRITHALQVDYDLFLVKGVSKSPLMKLL